MRTAMFIALFLVGCSQPEIKKLSLDSQKEIDSIANELNLEDFQYSYNRKSANGKTKSFFSIKLSNIEDSVDFKPYNNRIILAFEKSGYDLKSQDFVRIGYFKRYIPVDLYVFYEIDPRTKQIIREGTH